MGGGRSAPLSWDRAAEVWAVADEMALEGAKADALQGRADAGALALARAGKELDALREQLGRAEALAAGGRTEAEDLRAELGRTEALLGEGRAELVRARNGMLDLVEGRVRLESERDGLRADLEDCRAACEALRRRAEEQGQALERERRRARAAEGERTAVGSPSPAARSVAFVCLPHTLPVRARQTDNANGTRSQTSTEAHRSAASDG